MSLSNLKAKVSPYLFMRTLIDIKNDLILAHKSKDWRKARKLSQEKEMAKKIKYCSWPECGLILSSGGSRNQLRLFCKMHNIMNRFYSKSLLFVAILFWLIPTIIKAQSVTFQWNPVVYPGLSGYKLYTGTNSGIYNITNDVGNVVTKTITNLVRGTTYYFALTSYLTNGLESLYSLELSYLVPARPPAPTNFVIISFVVSASTNASGPFSIEVVRSSTMVPLLNDKMFYKTTSGIITTNSL